MNIDQSLILLPPARNPVVESGFKKFPIYVRRETLLTHEQSLHIQPGVEINLTLEGKGAYVIGKQIYMQSPGQLIIFPGSTPHQIYVDSSSHFKRVVICFEKNEWMNSSNFTWFDEPDCKHIQLSPDLFTLMKSISFMMHDELNEQKHGWQQVIQSQLTSLLIFIQRSMDEGAGSANPSIWDQKSLISLCCNYIDKHLHEPLSLKGMASMIHMSPEHLTRIFKKKLGISFYQYVLRKRVNESERLLIHSPDMSLTDIAYAAGFTSSAQFSRVFKSQHGLTPSKYRYAVNNT